MKTARAPVRVDFTGGYTDIKELLVHRHGAAVNAAIALYTIVHGRLREDGQIYISSLDTGTNLQADSADQLRLDGQMDIVKGLIWELLEGRGVELHIQSEAPLGSGLGTSAALGVAVAALFNSLTGAGLSRLELAHLAERTERRVGIAGGIQDQIASAFGGFHLIECSEGATENRPLQIPQTMIDFFRKGVLLVHPGGSRDSTNLVEDIVWRYQRGDEALQAGLARLNALARKLTEALLSADSIRFCGLIEDVRECQRMLHPDISTEHVEKIFNDLAAIGVTSGKQLGGAGSGSCILFLCDPMLKHRSAALLQAAGCRLLTMRFDDHGVLVEA